jgi:hypothetical protein
MTTKRQHAKIENAIAVISHHTTTRVNIEERGTLNQSSWCTCTTKPLKPRVTARSIEKQLVAVSGGGLKNVEVSNAAPVKSAVLLLLAVDCCGRTMQHFDV